MKEPKEIEVRVSKQDHKIPNDLFDSLSKGLYPTTSVTVHGVGEFVLHFPSGKDEMASARMTARYIGNMSRDSFHPGIMNAIERDCTLIVCIDSYPEDFPEAWKNEGFFDYPKPEVKNAIFKAFDTFLAEVKKKI